MTNYNDGKWHGWNGGECPVHPESIVQVQLACETRLQVEEEGEERRRRAEDWGWGVGAGAGAIVAFRVIKEHREPREFWIDPKGRDVLHKKPLGDAHHYIHVREVLK